MALTKMDTKTDVTSETMIMDDELENYVSKFSEKSIGMLTQRMTKMYSNPIEAAVRETISNAIDATLSLPETERKPIEVLSPTELDNNFIVQDYGIGMSHEDVNTHFTQYGSSTKEKNFDAIGAYGLGSKAPLAYASSFTVDTVKDGVKTQFMMARDNELIKTTVLGVTETSEPNGTKVMIPVEYDDVSSFMDAAKTYAEYTDGRVPIMIDGQGSKFDERWTSFDTVILDNDSGTTGRLYFRNESIDSVINAVISKYDMMVGGVIGGWPYSLTDSGYYSSKAFDIVLELKPGVVNFSTSRDAITKDYRLKKVIGIIDKALKPENSTRLLDKLFAKIDDEAARKVWYHILSNDLLNANIEQSMKQFHPAVVKRYLSTDKATRADAMVSMDTTYDGKLSKYQILGIKKFSGYMSYDGLSKYHFVAPVMTWDRRSSFRRAFEIEPGMTDDEIKEIRANKPFGGNASSFGGDAPLYDSDWVKPAGFDSDDDTDKASRILDFDLSCPIGLDSMNINYSYDLKGKIAITGTKNREHITSLLCDYAKMTYSNRGTVLFALFDGKPNAKQKKALDDDGYTVITIEDAKAEIRKYRKSRRHTVKSDPNEDHCVHAEVIDVDLSTSFMDKFFERDDDGYLRKTDDYPRPRDFYTSELKDDDMIVITNGSDYGNVNYAFASIVEGLKDSEHGRIIIINHGSGFKVADIRPIVKNGNLIILHDVSNSIYDNTRMTRKFDWKIFKDSPDVKTIKKEELNSKVLDTYFMNHKDSIVPYILKNLVNYDDSDVQEGRTNILGLAAQDCLTAHGVDFKNKQSGLTKEEEILNDTISNHSHYSPTIRPYDIISNDTIQKHLNNNEFVEFMSMLLEREGELPLDKRIFLNSANLVINAKDYDDARKTSIYNEILTKLNEAF